MLNAHTTAPSMSRQLELLRQLDEILDNMNRWIVYLSSKIKLQTSHYDRAVRLGNAKGLLPVEGQLRPYQLEAVHWLRANYENGLNCMLADETGLGKTVECIASIANLVAFGLLGPFLVVAPASRAQYWALQLRLWMGHVLKAVLCVGSDEERKQMWPDMLAESRDGRGSGLVMITTYELLHKDQEGMRCWYWKLAILDDVLEATNYRLLCAALPSAIGDQTTQLFVARGNSNLHKSNLEQLSMLAKLLFCTGIMRDRHVPHLDLARLLDWSQNDREWFAAQRESTNWSLELEPRVLPRLRKILQPWVLRRHKVDVGLVAPVSLISAVVNDEDGVVEVYDTSIFDDGVRFQWNDETVFRLDVYYVPEGTDEERKLQYRLRAGTPFKLLMADFCKRLAIDLDSNSVRFVRGWQQVPGKHDALTLREEDSTALIIRRYHQGPTFIGMSPFERVSGRGIDVIMGEHLKAYASSESKYAHEVTRLMQALRISLTLTRGPNLTRLEIIAKDLALSQRGIPFACTTSLENLLCLAMNGLEVALNTVWDESQAARIERALRMLTDMISTVVDVDSSAACCRGNHPPRLPLQLAHRIYVALVQRWADFEESIAPVISAHRPHADTWSLQDLIMSGRFGEAALLAKLQSADSSALASASLDFQLKEGCLKPLGHLETNGSAIRMTPLHLAVLEGASLQVMEVLVALAPSSVRAAVTDLGTSITPLDGKLPLHLCPSAGVCVCVHVCMCACVHVCMCACVPPDKCPPSEPHLCMCACACMHA